MTSSGKVYWLPLGLLIVLGGVVFGQALNWEFVWDDNHYLVDDATYRMPDSATDPIFQAFFVSPNYFRPLVVASFVAQLRIHDLNPLYFHLVNVSVHLLTGVVFFFLLQKLWLDNKENVISRAGVLVLSCLFVASPIVVEPVSWVSGRFDLLFGLFSLVVLLIYLKAKRTALSNISLFSAYLAACLSKEHAVAVPAIAFLMGFVHRGDFSIGGLIREFHQRLFPILILISAGLAYILIRWLVLGYVYVDESSHVESHFSLATRAIIVVRSMGANLIHLCLPFYDVSPVYTLNFKDLLGEPVGIVEFLVGLSLIPAVIAFAMHSRCRGLLLFTIAFILSILPVSNILRLNGTDNYIALRFLYFPYAVFLMFFPVWLDFFKQYAFRTGWQLKAGVIYCLINAFVAHSTVSVWESNSTLWNWGYAMRSDSFMANSNLIADLVQKRQFETAISVAEKYLKNKPPNINVMQSLALAYAGLGDSQKAVTIYEDLFLKFGVSSPKVLSQLYAGLARVLMQNNAGDPQIEAVCRAAIALYSQNRQARYVLSRYLVVREGGHQEAVSLLKDGLSMAPLLERKYVVGELRQDPIASEYGFTSEEYEQLLR